MTTPTLTPIQLANYIRRTDIVWYGPHACDTCGERIVRASGQGGGIPLDAPHDHHYPNHKWVQHECPVKPEPVDIHAEARAAFAAGKELQFRRRGTREPWSCASEPSWRAEVEYRVKPEPVKKLRSWEPSEVPILNTLYRSKNADSTPQRFIVTAVLRTGLVQATNINKHHSDSIPLGNGGYAVTTETAFKLWEHSTDSGKTWQPCGVLE